MIGEVHLVSAADILRAFDGDSEARQKGRRARRSALYKIASKTGRRPGRPPKSLYREPPKLGAPIVSPRARAIGELRPETRAEVERIWAERGKLAR